MKLVVPLMMPASHWIRLAERPSRSALMMGMPPRHGRLEGHHHALLLGGGENLVAMHGQQGLVGGDHVLAVLDGLQDQLLGHAVAADELHHNVDFRIRHHRESVVRQPGGGAGGDLPGQLQVLVRHCGDADRPAGAAGDFFLVTLENGEGAATDGADAQESNIDRFHFKAFLKQNEGMCIPSRK